MAGYTNPHIRRDISSRLDEVYAVLPLSSVSCWPDGRLLSGRERKLLSYGPGAYAQAVCLVLDYPTAGRPKLAQELLNPPCHSGCPRRHRRPAFEQPPRRARHRALVLRHGFRQVRLAARPRS